MHPMLVLRSSVHYTVVLLGVCTTPAVLLGVYTGGVCVGGWVGGWVVCLCSFLLLGVHYFVYSVCIA